MKQLQKLKFKSEEAERSFWESAKTEDYFDFSKSAKLSLSKLKPSTKSITLRMPEALIKRFKLLAKQKDVPYQSLMKIYLAERIEKELGK